MNRLNLVEHPVLEGLLPHLQSYCQKGLREIESTTKTFKVSSIESYAASVFERVGELDNAIKSIRLTMDFIFELKGDHKNFADIYRYHYENFFLRLIGLADRSYLLVGTSLQLNPTKLESMGANKFVSTSVLRTNPEVHQCLSQLDVAIAKHRILRNEIAHLRAFSNRELGLFSAIEMLSIDVGEKIDIQKLKAEFSSKENAELVTFFAEVVTTIEELLEALASTYKEVLIV